MSQALHPALQLLNRTSLVTQIIIGLLAGIALAVIAPQAALSVGFIGNVFVSALKAVAPVLVFILVMSSIANHQQGQQTHIRPILLMYLIGTFSAALVAVVAALAFAGLPSGTALFVAAPLAMAGRLPPLWLHVLSVSSSLGPDCRVAVVSGTPDLVQGMCAHQALGPRAVSRWLQALVAQLWRQASRGRGRGSWQHMAGSYAARRAALAQALRRHGVAGDWERGEGLHAWLPVADEAAVVQHMAARGWAVQAGAPLRLGSGPAIRINLAALGLRDMGRLARDLAAALRAVS